jgi:hypothetical protein
MDKLYKYEKKRQWMIRRLTSGLLQAGFASRDKYTENQIFARVENLLETPPAASRYYVSGNVGRQRQTPLTLNIKIK